MEGDPRELALVKEAITARVSGCCEWDADAAERVNRDRELAHWGLTPRLIKQLLIEHIEAGELVEQRVEEREPWRDHHAYWYRVNVSIEDVPRPLFVEVRFIQAGPTLPVVRIVSSHF
jgi:hypothetical protein